MINLPDYLERKLDIFEDLYNKVGDDKVKTLTTLLSLTEEEVKLLCEYYESKMKIAARKNSEINKEYQKNKIEYIKNFKNEPCPYIGLRVELSH